MITRMYVRWNLTLIVVFCCCAQCALLAQDNTINKISISSPTAASLGKFGDIPVNYHTGIPQINIPIYTVKSGPLSLPIGLSYHASGLKVMEPASWVGAGWALNAGGVITRTVVGAPDERGTNNAGLSLKGHFSDYGYNSYSGNQTYWNEFAEGRKDGEPDLFFFNFGSHSGKFYFNDDRTPILLPEEDFKIEPHYTGVGSIQSFIITTPDGVKYYFGNTPGITGTPPIEINKNITKVNDLSTDNIISSWFLNKISTMDNQFEISLAYMPEHYGFFTLSLHPVEGHATDYDSGVPPVETEGYGLVKNIINGVRLSSISFPEGRINFVPGDIRQDLSNTFGSFLEDPTNNEAVSLGSINICNINDVPIKKYKFSYGYFEDPNTSLVGSLALFNSNIQADRRRLKLLQLQEFNPGETDNIPPHLFTYFTEFVPRRLSFGIDHWGFYNGVNTNDKLIPPHRVTFSNYIKIVDGGNRGSSFPSMRGGTLRKITYPTGGSTEFEFEANSVYKSTTQNELRTLSDLVVRLYGQSQYTTTSIPFNVNTNIVELSFYYTSSYSGNFTIRDNNGLTAYSTPITGNWQTTITLQPGTYSATLSVGENVHNPNQGGIQAQIKQWTTSQTSNNVTVGGLRVRKITNYDNITSNQNITSYTYGTVNQSSGVLYSRPSYVNVLRNDLIKTVGYYQGNSFYTPLSINGCTSVFDAEYYKSPSSIRPMATTQGSHIGYSEVKVFQSGNGYSKYRYYGTSPWQSPTIDVAVTSVNATGCDGNAPNYPSAPVDFDFMRGQLQYEAHFNEVGEILKEVEYIPSYVQKPVSTPAFIVIAQRINSITRFLGTYYQLTTSRKTQTQVTTLEYIPGGGRIKNIVTSFYESPFHNQVTKISTTNSNLEVLETKQKYASDFRLSTCDGISDGYQQYTAKLNSCQSTYNTARQQCSGQGSCLSLAYINFQKCRNDARIDYVDHRKINFTDLNSTFKNYHNTAKLNADGELKPILELHDNYANPVIETTKWVNNNLIGATFMKYDYVVNPTEKVYPSVLQQISLAAPSGIFTPANTTSSNISILKDSRFVDETYIKYDFGNVSEIAEKNGVVTSYKWGYNKSYPFVQVQGANYATISALVNQGILNNPLSTTQQINNEFISLRAGLSNQKVLIKTFTYNPLKGIASQTNESGRVISYEYDSFGRLHVIKDQNNNVLKVLDYKHQVTPLQ